MQNLLAGKSVVITGGSRSLGQAICESFAANGAKNIAFTYRNDEEGVRETLARTKGTGANVKAHKLSNLEYDKTCALFKQLDEEWGGIDILVNNAGVNQLLPVSLLEEEDWDYVMDINVKGTFLTSKAALRFMIRRKRGCIVNVGSLAGMRMLEAPIHYSASKAAIKGLTESMAKEVAKYNIRVICFAPGLLEAGVGASISEGRLKDYLKHCSIGRLGTVEEAAKYAAFMASDYNSYMNGETVVMDGGL